MPTRPYVGETTLSWNGIVKLQLYIFTQKQYCPLACRERYLFFSQSLQLCVNARDSVHWGHLKNGNSLCVGPSSSVVGSLMIVCIPSHARTVICFTL